MYSSEDFEKLWFLYKLDGQSKNVSIESFCLQQGVSYQLFYKWFSSRKKLIVPVEVVGLPTDPLPVEEGKPDPWSCQGVIVPSAIQTVSICLSNGVQVSKSNLSYSDLYRLVEKNGGLMLTISGLRDFYFLPHFHDMRCGYSRIMEVIRMSYHRNPYKGDVFFFMSKNERSVRMVMYEKHSPVLKAQVLEKDSILNCDETWCRVKMQDKYKKAYIWCMVCMAHVRAKFQEALLQGKDEQARPFMEWIGKLYGYGLSP